ncbi:hypothetical protein FNV43_RR19408 [Rhamnella rubrinervis]|uniref:Uncharacterized protein n=1 Tax=Rhamnella rubrinervis TaxID=2594499 RepID=A0A8K0GT98_9ROSA|nr:hypothetical protein FNV43_RR19408 [Rhamnella rubrinervis]
MHATISSLCEVSEPLTSNHNVTYSFGFHMTLRTKNRIKNRIKKCGCFSIRSTYSACIRSLLAFPNTTSSSVATTAAVKPIRERSDLLTPANVFDNSLRHNSCYHIMKEPYSPPPTNLEGHKTANSVDHRMWTIRLSPHQSIWIGTKHSLVTINHGNGWLSGCTCPKLTVPLSRSSPVVKPKGPFYLGLGVKLHLAPSPGTSNQLE